MAQVRADRLVIKDPIAFNIGIQSSVDLDNGFSLVVAAIHDHSEPAG